jgi:hypothetical protein
MPDLTFRVSDVVPAKFTATPTISVRLHIIDSFMDEAIQSVLLNCQVQLQPRGRPYNAIEEARLLDLFGERERWGSTMKPLLWTNLVVKVPPFSAETAVDIQLPCSFDFDVAANKYFYGVEAGQIAVALMFSGTVFFTGAQGAMQIAQIPWDREARFQLDVDVWKAAIDMHYPGAAWLRLSRDAFDRLYRYKVSRGIPMWEGVLNRLLDQAERGEIAGAAAEGAAR